MLARTHDLFAFGMLLTAAVYFPSEKITLATIVVVIIANIVGALLPDIDQASNRLWDLLPGGNLVGKLLRNLFLSHRTITHSILGVWLIYQLIGWLTPKIFNPLFVDTQKVIIAVMIGYGSHLLLDSFTEEGLPLLFPIKVNFGFPPTKSWRIKTGNWFEKLVVFPGITIGVVIFGISRWTTILEWLRP